MRTFMLNDLILIFDIAAGVLLASMFKEIIHDLSEAFTVDTNTDDENQDVPKTT